MKQGKIISFILSMMILLLIPVVSSAAEEENASSGLFYEICLEDGRIAAEDSGSERISFFPLEEEGTYGFVLPGFWDSSELRICLNGVDRVQIDGVDYWDGDSISLPVDEAVTAFIIIDEMATAVVQVDDVIELTVRQTGGLPVLFLETESGSSDAIHADKTVKEPGSLRMTDAAGEMLYQGNLSAIRTRGNATVSYRKKPYQIKLEKKAALTGNREGKTWILLANALDRSQIRNTIALGLARYSGAFAYTPNSQPVDLYLNHDYKGTYLLTEKVEIGSNRLQIFNLEKETEELNPELDFETLSPRGTLEVRSGGKKYYELPEEPEDLTGGYLVQLNVFMRYKTEASGFVTTRGCTFTAQEPKYLSQAQASYLFGVFQRIENGLYSEDGIDLISGKHFTELLDLSTFVNKYLMAEVLDDYDGQYTYFYKDTDAVDPKVYTGPVWDQDNILGVWLPQSNPEAIHLTEEGKAFLGWTWFSQAAQHEEFLEAVQNAYFRIYHPGVRILLGQEEDPEGNLRSIEEYAAEIRTSAEMDYFRWTDPMGPEANKERYNTRTGSTFEEQVRYLTEYLNTRLDALDEFYEEICR